MILRLLALAGLVLASPALAHRLDGYLQASVLRLGAERVTIALSLTPGHREADLLIGAADADGDGALSAAEYQRYGETVVRGLALDIDGDPVPLTLEHVSAPETRELREGTAPLILRLTAPLPQGIGAHRLTYRNAFRSEGATRLVNAERPEAPFEIDAQLRDASQSTYELTFRRVSP